jgi:hypothetical protein
MLPLSHAIPGWEGSLIREAVERVALGVQREKQRLIGSRYLVVVRIDELDYDGLSQRIEIVSGHTDLSEALARAQSVGAERIVTEGRRLDPERKWKHTVPGDQPPNTLPGRARRVLPGFFDALWDGVGWNKLTVNVAVHQGNPQDPLDAEFTKAVNMTPELVHWFSEVADKR